MGEKLEPAISQSFEQQSFREKAAKTLAAGILVTGIGVSLPGGASELQAHQASDSGWTVLGGDPLIEGGVHSANQVAGLIESNLGRRTLEREGLNGSEISAIQSDAKKGEIHGCTLRFGETFKATVFGPGGNQIDSNVTFADPRYRNGAAAFCEEAVLAKTTQTKHFIKDLAGQVTEEIIDTNQKIERIDILVPQKCGNVALQGVNVEHKANRTIIIKQQTPPTTTTTTTTVPPTTTTTSPIYIYYPPPTPPTKGTDPGIGG